MTEDALPPELGDNDEESPDIDDEAPLDDAREVDEEPIDSDEEAVGADELPVDEDVAAVLLVELAEELPGAPAEDEPPPCMAPLDDDVS